MLRPEKYQDGIQSQKGQNEDDCLDIEVHIALGPVSLFFKVRVDFFGQFLIKCGSGPLEND
jgi:hypothetical protein